MIQQVIIYILVAASVAYIAFRLYSSIRKKNACESCALMKAAKKTGPPKITS